MAVLMGATQAVAWSGFDMAQAHMLDDVTAVNDQMASPEGWVDLMPDAMLPAVQEGLELMDLIDPIEQASILMRATGMDGLIVDVRDDMVGSNAQANGAALPQRMDGAPAITAADMTRTVPSGPRM